MVNEPLTEAAIGQWVERANLAADPFFDLYEASEAHRAEHGCDVFPSGNAPILTMLVSIARPQRVLEVGCGLGYSALSLARGCGEGAVVETIEHDSMHADLAEANIAARGFADRIRILRGKSNEVLRSLAGPYDFAFFDGDPEGCVADLQEFERLVPSGGVLVSSNLFLGRYVPDAPWIAELAAYRERLTSGSAWDTVFFSGGKALSRRR